MFSGGGIEFEAKFLDIDENSVKTKLKKLGAKLVHGKKKYVRAVFHRCTNEIRGFARVRDEGGKVTMTVKTYANPKFPEETEIETSNSFEETVKFVRALGIQQKAYQETYREKWSIDDPEIHEITFDNVPGLPVYMEIDCTTESKLNEMVEKLGLDKTKMRFGAFDVTYEEYYGIQRGVINDNTPSITFANIRNEIKPIKNMDLFLRVIGEQSQIKITTGAGSDRRPYSRRTPRSRKTPRSRNMRKK